MSWGYIPKKLRKQRRQKRARKKYQNFSCLTCDWANRFCPRRGWRDSWITPDIVKNCDQWRPSYEAKFPKKATKTPSSTKNKKPRKGLFSKRFK